MIFLSSSQTSLRWLSDVVPSLITPMAQRPKVDVGIRHKTVLSFSQSHDSWWHRVLADLLWIRLPNDIWAAHWSWSSIRLFDGAIILHSLESWHIRGIVVEKPKKVLMFAGLNKNYHQQHFCLGFAQHAGACKCSSCTTFVSCEDLSKPLILSFTLSWRMTARQITNS